VSGALLDTSVVIARGDDVDPSPSSAISTVTLGELLAGVHLAPNETVRRLRRDRLNALRAAFAPLSVDESVAEQYGKLLAHARSMKRSDKATDLLIAATAAATGRVLHTLDSQQAALARSAGISVA